MGTSSWQNIPFCVDALMRIEPRRVLDVGVGFGRWGILVHEFCDVWFQRVLKDQWKVHVEGIEGFAQNLAEYHRDFYNKIHVGDARDLIPALPGPWDVVIFGDVLEHFEKDVASSLLRECLRKSGYVMVNVPLGEEYPQGELYGNKFEAHLSSWEPGDFLDFSLVRKGLFRDFRGRPFGTFILSTQDPRGLRDRMFSRTVDAAEQAMVLERSAELDRAVRLVREQREELAYIKSYSTYKWAAELRRSGMWNAARWLRHRNDRVATVRALGAKNEASQGNEVWLLAARTSPGGTAVPWDFLEPDGSWQRRAVADCPYGECLVSTGGVVRIPLDHNPELRFLRHGWSGLVEVTFKGRREVIDLYSAAGSEAQVFPALTPMLSATPAPGRAMPIASAAAHAAPPAPARPAPDRLSESEELMVKSLRGARATVLAVHCPQWLGISSSTRVLFEHTYPVPATAAEDPFHVPPEVIEHHAHVIAATGVEQVVFSGGDEAHLALAARLRVLAPGVRMSLLWHGSYVQFKEDYAWRILQEWVDRARAGEIEKIGVVKAGMEKFFENLGVASALVLNYVPGLPEDPPEIPGEGTHLGMWLSGTTYRKIPHAMLAAVSMVPGARLHAAGLDRRSQEVVEFLRIGREFVSERPIPHAQLMNAIRRTHASLYVTFSECCPMLPLESLRAGVPCLVGPTSHLFEDNSFLHERLVVPYPDRADAIAEAAVRAVSERHEIIEAARGYLPEYNRRAEASVASFLGESPRVVLRVGAAALAPAER